MRELTLEFTGCSNIQFFSSFFVTYVFLNSFFLIYGTPCRERGHHSHLIFLRLTGRHASPEVTTVIS